MLYKYKDKVEVPVLGMVDDVLSVATCSSKSVITNDIINSFMELNKLKLAEKKCAKKHIEKNNNNCSTLKVHDNIIKESNLGEILVT